VLEVPPAFTSVSRPEVVLNSSQPFSVSAGVQPDPARSIIRVRLHYRIDGQTITRGMIGLPGSKWSNSIPAAGKDGAFVEYWISALDNAGAEVDSQVFVYRVLDGGLDSISDIQETAGGGGGPSPFAGLSLSMRINGVIQSDPDRSGMFVLQDDSLVRPWSGILLDAGSVQAFGLRRGDEFEISHGRVLEMDGTSVIEVVEAEKLDSRRSTFARVVATTEELNQPRTAESLEGMLVRIENASILDQLDDSTWEIWNGSVLDAIDLSTESPSVTNELVEIWETRPFIDGIWVQRGESWILIPESANDFAEVINVAVQEERPDRARLSTIGGTYPNPFADRVSIEYLLARSGVVKIEVFDVAGRLVVIPVDGPMPAGRNVTLFDAKGLAPGPYLVRLSTASGSDTAVVVRLN
jgi:hypothetical protein